MKKLCGAFTLVVALTIGATAVAESTKILSGASEASGASLVYDTGGAITEDVTAAGFSVTD